MPTSKVPEALLMLVYKLLELLSAHFENLISHHCFLQNILWQKR